MAAVSPCGRASRTMASSVHIMRTKMGAFGGRGKPRPGGAFSLISRPVGPPMGRAYGPTAPFGDAFRHGRRGGGGSGLAAREAPVPRLLRKLSAVPSLAVPSLPRVLVPSPRVIPDPDPGSRGRAVPPRAGGLARSPPPPRAGGRAPWTPDRVRGDGEGGGRGRAVAGAGATAAAVRERAGASADP